MGYMNEDNGFSMLKLSGIGPLEQDQEINAKRKLSNIIKQSKKQIKSDKCYYCGKKVNSFCNSHTLPQFCLRSIARNGKVQSLNSILKIPGMREFNGIKNSGTFNMICKDCDSRIFKDYENPKNYDNKPTIEMLAEIDMKNSLKNIYRAKMTIEMLRQSFEIAGIDDFDGSTFNKMRTIDLEEFVEDYKYAKHSSLKPFATDYHIGYHRILPYVVPLAIQGSLAMLCDLEGNIINDLYCEDPRYKILNLDVCVFPLEDKTSIFMFVKKKNKRYARFFKQLNKIPLIDDQLALINYILFSYSEDIFISPICSQKAIMKLKPLTEKSLDMFSTLDAYFMNSKVKSYNAKKNFDFSDYKMYPNLLSEEYAIRKQSAST